MHGSEVDHLELVILVLLVLVASLALVAKRLQLAYPIVVVLGGLVISLVPHVPQISLDPKLVFLVILPPLVYSAAFHTSWRDFRRNLVGIVMLAFGLVGFTIFGVAATTRALIPGFDWKLGLVLGSVVAATDAIAATATARRLGLPQRISDLLEAESLVNDGSGLVALKFTLAMVVTGVTPTFTQGALTLLYLVFAAVVVGLTIGAVVHLVQRRINEAPVEITISIITPYVAYLLAEQLNCSGVLATLACGLYLGRRSSGHLSLHARIEASAVWRTIDFMLNGVVFLVLGLQLPSILANIRGNSFRNLIEDGVVFSLSVVVLRLLWVFPGAWISNRIRQHLLRHKPAAMRPKETFLVGWAGMRGVLALAAALSLPETLASGARLPYRDLMIFLTFCAIFTTLVVQGLSMPVLIRRLGLEQARSGLKEEAWARREMVSSALAALAEIRSRERSEEEHTFDHLESYYRRRLARLEPAETPEQHESRAEKLELQRFASQELRDVERSVALRLRDENKIHDEVLRRLEHELDLLDARFSESE